MIHVRVEDFTMTTATTTAPAMKGAKDSAAYCGIGRSLFLSLVSTAKAPKPVKLGRRTLWRMADLEAWISGGCGRWEG